MSLLKIDLYESSAPLAIPSCFQPSTRFQHSRNLAFQRGATNAAATAIADSSTNVDAGITLNGPLHQISTPGKFSSDDDAQNLDFNGVNKIVEILRNTSFKRDARHE